MLIAAASQLAETILGAAIRAPEGYLWLKHEALPSSTRRALVPVPFDLEYGQLGIALFLALLADATGRVELRTSCRSALRPILAALEYSGEGPSFLDRFGVRVLVSVWRGLALVARVLDDSQLLADLNPRIQRAVCGRLDTQNPAAGTPEVMQTVLNVSNRVEAKSSWKMDTERVGGIVSRIEAAPFPPESVLNGGLAGRMYMMLQAAEVQKTRQCEAWLFASSREMVRRLESGHLGGYLCDRSLVTYSPTLLDGLSGIGAILVLTATMPTLADRLVGRCVHHAQRNRQ